MIICLVYCMFQHTLIVADPQSLITSPVMVGIKKVNPVLFRGVGYADFNLCDANICSVFIFCGMMTMWLDAMMLECAPLSFTSQ